MERGRDFATLSNLRLPIGPPSFRLSSFPMSDGCVSDEVRSTRGLPARIIESKAAAIPKGLIRILSHVNVAAEFTLRRGITTKWKYRLLCAVGS
jgi:hypothetical protein